MIRLSILVVPIIFGCESGVTCKVVATECVDELEMFTCIDDKLQAWYEFSDGKQVACLGPDCATVSDEAAAYCNGLDWVDPE